MTAQKPMLDPVDVFVSYTQADRAWAEWIACELEDADCRVVIQAWDFPVGSNFVVEMNRALSEARSVLLVLSPAYFRSYFAELEWTAALADGARLVPVLVASCEVPSLLRPLVHTSLVSRSESGARAALLAAVATGRSRPGQAPFPGRTSAESRLQRARRYPGTLPALFHVARARNPLFSGRDQALQALHDRLLADVPGEGFQAVLGLGGVGKTELALEYAYRYAHEYEGVVWFSANDAAVLAGEYAALAASLGLSEGGDQGAAVATVRRELSDRGRVLLIFDDVTEQRTLDALLPQGTEQRVLVTTRLHDFPDASLEKLGVLEEEAAVGYLCRRTGQRDEHAARSICARVGSLPLALEQAAAYVRTRGRTLADYDRLLAEHGLAALEPGKPHHHEQTVGTTWSIALKELVAHRGAAELLNLCAFLAPEPIHLGDLLAGASRIRQGHAEGRLPEPLPEVLAGELTLDDAKAEVMRYSLVGADSTTLSIHPLVQLVVRQQLEQEKRRLSRAAAWVLITAAFPVGASDVRSWPACVRLLPHALALLRTDDERGLERQSKIAFATLANRVGLYFKSRARYEEADRLYRLALGAFEEELGPSDSSVATVLSNIALLLRATDRAGDAEPLLKRALEIDEARYGGSHPRVATHWNNLGLVMRALGRTLDAEDCFRRALEIDRAAPPELKADVATDLVNLGDLLTELGRWDEAAKLLNEARACDEASHGPKHPRTARADIRLARLLRKRGEPQKAFPLLQRALAIHEAEYGADHPSTLEARNECEAILGEFSATSTDGDP